MCFVKYVFESSGLEKLGVSANFILKMAKHRTYFVKVLKNQWRFHAVRCYCR